jgi:deoxyadenosine/deoxycytidine kinase
LQAPTHVLLSRIHKRGIPAEQAIEADYLNRLNDAYTSFFHYYDKSPLLIVNSTDIDLVGRDEHYQQLVDRILQAPQGIHYFNPSLALL